MRRIVIPTLMLLIGCATGAVVREVVVPARAQGQTGPNYEYDVAEARSGLDAKKQLVSQYGQQGWRLVTASYTPSGTFLYFERQKAQ
jgi:hypothetical protein